MGLSPQGSGQRMGGCFAQQANSPCWTQFDCYNSRRQGQHLILCKHASKAKLVDPVRVSDVAGDCLATTPPRVYLPWERRRGVRRLGLGDWIWFDRARWWPSWGKDRVASSGVGTKQSRALDEQWHACDLRGLKRRPYQDASTSIGRTPQRRRTCGSHPDDRKHLVPTQRVNNDGRP